MKEKRVSYRLEMASSEDISYIHSATLELLSEKGASLEDREAIDLLLTAGAENGDNERIIIPENLVQQTIDSAPSKIQIYSRNGREAMCLGDNSVYCGTGSDCLFVIDSETDERRLALKQDIKTFTRLSDALPNIDFILSMGVASDTPTQTADLHHFQAMVYNTTKPIVFTIVEQRNMPLIIDFASKIAGNYQALKERPFIIHYAMPSPPLHHSKTALQNIIFCARSGIPVVFASGTQSGVSGPMTIAGGIVSANTDVLTGLVVHQLANPGAPFIYGVGISPLDMKTTVDSYGAPEGLSGDLVNAQVAKHYELPTWGYIACTDSKILDLQAAMEYVGSTMTGLLSHCHLVHDIGYLESGLTTSCESIVFGNEVVEYVRRILQPIDINEETVPMELLKEVGPNQTFFESDHTLKHLRDFYYSSLIDRNRFLTWGKGGHLTMFDRLKTRVKQILSTHQPLALNKTIIEEIDNMIADEDKRVAPF
ncbi:MAG: trimethylamine methyltransferase family protein [Candidatus Hodarchaeales archaeon]